MAPSTQVDADLRFSLDLPHSRPVTGSLTGTGSVLQLRVSSPFMFAGRTDASAIRGLARSLAEKGVSITVVAPAGPLVTLGAARTRWWQRRLTGSRHIRIEGGAGLWSLVRGRSQAPRGGALPSRALLPPGTLFPIAPTLRRRRRLPVTTTHDPDRGGNPRLYLSLGPHPMVGERQTVFSLRDGITTIGSSDDCDISLTGLEPFHAEVRHDEKDDLVLARVTSAGTVAVFGETVETAVLRTGSRIDIGSWQLTYVRDEYADHGRPYGGRIGGEFGHQRPQPSREQLQRQAEENR